jgi:hypothetical protein
MPRTLICHAQAHQRAFQDRASALRRDVLAATVAALASPEQRQAFHTQAQRNLARWHAQANAAPSPQIAVVQGDWGQVTRALTQATGRCFAVLNMANAYVPGGAYVEGAPAQEENMFRRTDCHFAWPWQAAQQESNPAWQDLHVACETYDATSSALLNARAGRVYLDRTPRVCLRGPEDIGANDLGYAWLPDADIFPFYELRAAAQDLRDGSAFDAAEMRKRIAAQLDTLIEHGVRDAVLSAFGCGAFRNPASATATLYAQELAARLTHFDCVRFAIFAPGYGPDNFTPFAEAFGQRFS